MHLFPRGDCAERDARRTPGSLGTRDRLRGKAWSRVLLDRVDFRGWATSKAFIACLYNIFLRREQYGAIKGMVLHDPTFQKNAPVLARLNAKHVLQAAVEAGDAASIRDILRNARVEDDVKLLLRKVQTVMRRIHGSDAERSALRWKFVAMRLWNGFSFIFFTLNPNEWGSSLTLSFRGPTREETKSFSLALSDEEMSRFYGQLSHKDKQSLMRWAIDDPTACVKCFWATLQLVFEELCQCFPGNYGQIRALPPDGVSSKTEPGIFAHVAQYVGAIEPQMRKALHLHALLCVHGFRHPRDFFSLADLAARIRRLWHYVASFCFRSVEAFAAHLHEPAICSERLGKIPLMPVKPAQQKLLGPLCTRQIYAAQLKARGMSAPCPKDCVEKKRFQPWAPSALRSEMLSSGEWARIVVDEVNAGNQSCGNHLCVPEVCNKTKRSRDGFCRMIFWHYAWMMVDGARKVIKVHGRELTPRWLPEQAMSSNGQDLLDRPRDHTSPPSEQCVFQAAGVADEMPPFHQTAPQQGAPALETNHVYHVKNSPLVLLTARCNNDVSPLVRIANELLLLLQRQRETSAKEVDEEPEGNVFESAVDEMLSTLNDLEFYCAEYSSKEQPHIEGLLQILHNALGRLKQDIARKRGSGIDVSIQEEARLVLHRLVSCTNRRMHKGFPEMVSYLYGFPAHVSSHAFSELYFENHVVALERALLKRFHLKKAAECDVTASQLNVEDELPVCGDLQEATLDLTSKNVGNKQTHKRHDYSWRHDFLVRCPLYFWVAMCRTEKTFRPGITWPWHEIRDHGVLAILGAHPCRHQVPCRDRSGSLLVWTPRAGYYNNDQIKIRVSVCVQ